MAKKMDMTFEPGLFDSEVSDEPDKWIPNKRSPTVLHPGHSDKNMRKPFIGWDGEGYTETRSDGSTIHHYWLLRNSLGGMVIAPPGRSLNRWTVARFFSETREKHPEAYHVGFSLNYDITMILRANGVSKEQCGDVVAGFMESDGYTFRVRWGKMIEIQDNRDKYKTLLQDVFGYFQKSFVATLDEYLGDDWPHRADIMRMKDARSSFDHRSAESDAEVIEYCGHELELLVDLMENVRNRCYAAGLPINRWYGPGAIADGLMARWKIQSCQVDLYKADPELAAVCQYAYSGGRFEVIRPGHINRCVYQYDIRSAYPAAIAELPNLALGDWRKLESPSLDELPEFSVVLMEWDCDTSKASHPDNPYPESIPFPLWRRESTGNTHFPSQGAVGWYWLPEAKAAADYADSLPETYNAVYQVREAWAFYPRVMGGTVNFSGDDKPVAQGVKKPFHHVSAMYELRKEMKAKGQGAEKALKLALNSLYGKLCQQVGKPKFHNMAMAGFVTASCRAKMIRAMMQKPHAVIAFETDAIFSDEPLDLDCENKLGNWELTQYDDMWYLQSGFRFCMVDGKVTKMATRGISVKNVTYQSVMELLTDSASVVPIKTTNFINMKWALSMNKRELIGVWRTQDKNMRMMLEGQGKRRHDPDCDACEPHSGFDGDVRVYDWHTTHRTRPHDAEQWELSRPHVVAWNPIEGQGRRKIDPEADPVGFNGEGDSLADLADSL